MTEVELNFLTFFDDRAFLFNTRKDVMIGTRFFCEAMAKWDLTLYAGYDGK